MITSIAWIGSVFHLSFTAVAPKIKDDWAIKYLFEIMALKFIIFYFVPYLIITMITCMVFKGYK